MKNDELDNTVCENVSNCNDVSNTHFDRAIFSMGGILYNKKKLDSIK
jgi:hypothetical protein